jgi:hypothetical protein
MARIFRLSSPRYPRRLFRYEPNAFEIDRYLNRLLLERVREICIE